MPNSITSLSVRASSSIAAKEGSVATFAPPLASGLRSRNGSLGEARQAVRHPGSLPLPRLPIGHRGLRLRIPPGQYTLDLAGIKVKETSEIGPRPEKPVEIYEFERLQRLFLYWIWMLCSILVQGTDRIFGPKWLKMGGKKQFPYMVPYLEDPNTEVQMFESAEIVEYLKATYAL